MKKISFTMVLLMILLSACMDRPYSPSKPMEPKENTMVINIKNNANFDFHGLQVDLLNHSQTTVYANFEKIQKEDWLSFEFHEDDFVLDGEAQMGVAIQLENGDTTPINKKTPIQLEKNKSIFLQITGDEVENARIEAEM